MKHTIRSRYLTAILPVLLASSAFGAPKLRLVNTTVGPVSIAVGTNGPAQSLEAYNGGDGALNLRLTSNQTWGSATAGSQTQCRSRGGLCIPINFAFSTSSLAKGVYSAVVTVSDPNAQDAPQTVAVSIQVGGGIPDSITFYTAPNGSRDEIALPTNSALTGRVSTTSGGNWLLFTQDGAGTFAFVRTYKLFATHQANMAEGTYNGALAVSDSSFAGDNKTVPVTLRVTSQPIAQASQARVQLRVAQGGPKQSAYVSLQNRGLGSLTATAPTVAAGTGGNFLTATLPAANLIQVTADPGSLAPGVYTATVNIGSNAVNGSQAVPVEFEVVAQSPPAVAYQAVLNNATFELGEAIAPGDITAVFGEQFILGDPVAASSLPLGQTLGGVRVLVNGQPVPVYYVSYGQINFQMPYSLAPGEATIRVERGGQAGNTATVQIATRAPRLLRLGIGDYGIAVNQDGTFPIPATPGIPTRPAVAGDVLVFYAIGLGPTTPLVADGAASPESPLATVPNAKFFVNGSSIDEGVAVTPIFTGLTPRFVGLYQINVELPVGINIGPNSVQLRVDNIFSNRVQILVK